MASLHTHTHTHTLRDVHNGGLAQKDTLKATVYTLVDTRKTLLTRGGATVELPGQPYRSQVIAAARFPAHLSSFLR